MKIKTASWVLSCLYVLCAVVLFAVASWCQTSFAERGVVLPALTRAAFAVGPLGWLFLTLAVGSVVVLKDIAFKSRVAELNYLFSIFLTVMVFFVAISMIVPSIPVRRFPSATQLTQSR